jgi:hypothetical protein
MENRLLAGCPTRRAKRRLVVKRSTRLPNWITQRVVKAFFAGIRNAMAASIARHAFCDQRIIVSGHDETAALPRCNPIHESQTSFERGRFHATRDIQATRIGSYSGRDPDKVSVDSA